MAGSVPDIEYDFAPAWMPEKDDILEGKVVAIDVGFSEYGKYPIVTIEQVSGGRKAFHAFHTAAISQLTRTQPNVGDTMGVKYLGEVEAKNKRAGYSDYHAYRVVVNNENGFNWDNFSD